MVPARLWRRRAYLASLVALLVFLVATVAADWPRLDPTQRVVFVGPIGLAAVIAARGLQAFRIARQRPRGWEVAYMEHIYFTCITLWEGFIVGLIGRGASPMVVAAVGVGLVIVGANRFDRYKAQILASRAELGPQSMA
jgi:hypothetical protein